MDSSECVIHNNFQSHDNNKMYCVLGVLDTPRGHEIEKYIIDNISSKYDVISVIHDGTKYEYPGINYTFNFSKINQCPVLYLHTKGAYNANPSQGRIINFWIDEFINNFEFYKNKINSNDPLVLCPFCGERHRNTWYNGFMINYHVPEVYGEVPLACTRYFYEWMFIKRRDIKIIARINSNINDENIKIMESYISKYKPIYFNNIEGGLPDHKKDLVFRKKESVLQFNKSNKDKMIGGFQKNPITIQDKLRWLNINDIPWDEEKNMPLKSICTDKILVKEYVKNKLGVDICIPTLKIYNNTSEIDWNSLPNQFVIKCNHGPGMNIICKDISSFDIQESIKKLNIWINDDFTFKNGFESHYHWINKKVFIEKYVDGTTFDYKIWCFNGIPYLYSINNYLKHDNIMYYNIDGSENNLYGYKPYDNYTKPKSFNLMIKYSKILSKDFKFVRVDFYEIDGKLYLGGLTFTPGAFGFRYKNPDDESKIGNLLKLW